MESHSESNHLFDLATDAINGNSSSINEILDRFGPSSMTDIPLIEELLHKLESEADPRSHVLAAILAFERADVDTLERELSLGIEANEIYALVLDNYFWLRADDEQVAKKALSFLENTPKEICPLASNLLNKLATEDEGANQEPIWDPSDLLDLLWAGHDVREKSIESAHQLEFNFGSYSVLSVAMFDIGFLDGSLAAEYWSLVSRLEKILEQFEFMNWGHQEISQRDLRIMQGRIESLKTLNLEMREVDDDAIVQLSQRIRPLQVECTDEEIVHMLRSADDYVINSLIRSNRLTQVQAENLKAHVEENLEESDLFDELIELLDDYDEEDKVLVSATPQGPKISDVSESMYRAQHPLASENMMLDAISSTSFEVWELFHEGWQSIYWHPNATSAVREEVLNKVFTPHQAELPNGVDTDPNLKTEFYAALDPRISELTSKRLAMHPSRLVRLALAKNPATSLSTRENLKVDSDLFVRSEAMQDWSWLHQVWPEA